MDRHDSIRRGFEWQDIRGAVFPIEARHSVCSLRAAGDGDDGDRAVMQEVDDAAAGLACRACYQDAHCMEEESVRPSAFASSLSVMSNIS
jgi:hypothetical protein